MNAGTVRWWGGWEGREEEAQIPSIQVFFRTLKRAVHAKWVT